MRRMTMCKILTSKAVFASVMLIAAAVHVGAQSVQQKDVMVAGQLTQGFDEGVNSSRGVTNWVTLDSSVGAQKMSCPAGQDWCAMFVVSQKVADPPRPSTDLSSY